jgi:hypothetical protein
VGLPPARGDREFSQERGYRQEEEMRKLHRVKALIPTRWVG